MNSSNDLFSCSPENGVLFEITETSRSNALKITNYPSYNQVPNDNNQ